MKSKLFVFSVILLFILPFYSFAGEGSDTIGACKILPQLRYSYITSDYHNDGTPSFNTKYENQSVYLQLNWGIHNNIDVYALVGASFIKLVAKGTSVDPAGLPHHVKFTFDPDTSFLWGVGAKGTFFRADSGFYCGAGICFTHSFTGDVGYDVYVDGVHMDHDPYPIRWWEYSLITDVHAGWHFKKWGLTPYAGVEYWQTWAYAEEKDNSDNRVSFHPDHPVGVYVGLDHFIADKLYLNVEGHMINRWGVNAGIGYLFDICGKPAPVVAPVIPESEPVLTPMK